MALALERRAVEIGLHRLQQRRVRHRGRRTPPRGLLALVPLLLACLPGRRAPSASAPTPDTRAGSRRGAPWPRRAWRSSPRPPHRSRAALLRRPCPLTQPLVLHRQLPDVPRRRVERLRHEVALAGLHAALKTGHGPVPPVLQPVDLDAHFPRQRLQRFRRAAAAAPRPASGPRSSAAPAPGAPPHLPRRRRALRSPSGLPPSPPTPSPARSSIEPFPPPPWTLDSPLISVQENWGRFTRGCGQAYALQTVEPVTYRCGTRRVCQARSSGSERYTRARPHAVAPMNCVPEDSRRRSTCTGRTHAPRALADGNQTPSSTVAVRAPSPS